MQIIKQSTARTLLVGPFLDDTDGKTAETGLTVTQADVRLSKNGGNMAQKNEATSCTHDELGYYTCPVDVTDTATLGILKLMISESGSLPVWQEFLVVTANVWDTLCSTDTFQADLTQIAGVVQSATDLQDFADSGYDPATNKVQGVVLVDSNTDMRGTDSAATEAKQDIIDTNVDAILVDTGTTLDALIKDVPTVAEFDARSLPSADYVITTDTIAGVTLCTTCTTNTDMRGTDGANTAVPDVAGTAATPAEVATALTDIHLDHLLAVDYDPASKPGVATALLNELIESDGGVSRYTANALEQAPSAGTNPNVLVDTTIAVVTDQTHFTLTAGSDIDDSYLDQAIVIYDASNNDFPSVRKVSDYIGATKTITLDSAPDFTILAGDGARTFVTAPGTVAPTASQNADAVWDEVLSGGAHNVGDSAGKRLREMFDAGLYEEETAQGGTLTTITLAATASALDDYYNAMSLTIIEGTGAGQVRTFEDYDGATRVATACRDWSVTPDATSKYVISGDSCVKVFGFQQRVLDDINAECDTALTDYDPPTNTEMVAAFTEIKGTTWTSGTDTLEHLRNKQTDIETDTSEIGAAGAGLTALGDARIANLDATVSSRLAPAGTLATVTNLTNAPTAGDLTATMKTSINTEADTALSDIHLDHLLATDY
ncbi:hypothetical protein KAR91_64830, partial [Candidatus Pacearchaeota archaeon]|nr:hypothetical protein [Candidatus Pacearchaeota archaeon]